MACNIQRELYISLTTGADFITLHYGGLKPIVCIHNEISYEKLEFSFQCFI